MTEWKELANINPFKEEAAKRLDPPSIEETAGLEKRYITSTDGREIPVFVDQASRSVYPVREI